MQGDVCIKGGRIIDPARQYNEVGDVAVSKGIIVDGRHGGYDSFDVEVNAKGCYVLPGLIDYHAHVFTPACDFAVPPSLLLASGVTTVIDAGSAGSTSYAAFKTFATTQPIRIRAMLNVSPTGLSTLRYHENVAPEFWDEDKIQEIFNNKEWPPVALKIRISKQIVGRLGVSPLKAAVKLADKIGCRVVAHITDPPCEVREILRILREGDVFCHVFQGEQPTIIERGGALDEAVWEGRRRGVLFDASNGYSHFSFDVAKAALRNGFMPDLISTDLTKKTFLTTHAFGLPYLMSKYMSLGIDFNEIVKAVTLTPAGILGMDGKIGTLRLGAQADICIVKIKEAEVKFKDAKGLEREYNKMIVPQMVIKAGEIVFRQYDFYPGF